MKICGVPTNYSINDLERISGIKAHTIRIWEKRYGLLSPARTDTNIRMYDDEDLRKILNVSTLLHDGWRISKVSDLDGDALEQAVWVSAQSGRSPDHIYQVYIQACISATLSFDEAWFESVFEEAMGRFGMPVLMQQIIGPFMYKVGLMWSVYRMHPGQEHFASNLVKRKMLAAIDALPPHQRKGKYLLFLPPWEEHELGLIYAWYLLREAGYEVIYMGQKVPVEALSQTCDAIRPGAMLAFLVGEQSRETISHFLESICRIDSGIRVYLATSQERLDGIVLPSNLRVLGSPGELQALL